MINERKLNRLIKEETDKAINNELKRQIVDELDRLSIMINNCKNKIEKFASTYEEDEAIEYLDKAIRNIEDCCDIML